MTPIVFGCGLACGAALLSRPLEFGSRLLGASVIAICALAIATPALADQTLMVSDNSRVDCIASSRDLTRISLVGDEIASVSKLQTGNPSEDFSVVNEPLRGDIYVSVPEGFTPKLLSFFATSKKGYVYKFACRRAVRKPSRYSSPTPRSPATSPTKRASPLPQIRRSKRSNWSRRCIRAASPTATGCGSRC